MGLERTTLVRNLKPLIAAGLVRDLAGEGERDRKLTVTPSGFKTLDAARTLWKKAQAGFKKHLGKEDFARFMAIAGGLEKLGTAGELVTL
jgi:DNA-binding MarR family transcriptional regulator